MIDLRTYQQAEDLQNLGPLAETFDMNAIPYEDREAYVHIRGLSYHLLDWFFSTHIICDGKKIPLVNARQVVFDEPLADILSVLYTFAETLQEYHPDVPGDKIQAQILLCIQKEDISSLMSRANHPVIVCWSLDQSLVLSVNKNAQFESMFSRYYLIMVLT